MTDRSDSHDSSSEHSEHDNSGKHRETTDDRPDNRPSTKNPPIDRLEEYLIPLETTTPATDRSSIASLRPVFESETVIGLGEATHGTREFFDCKHRLLRYLITELDLRLIGFESVYATTLRIDEFVRNDSGNTTAALQNLQLWPWKVESVRDLVQWIRRFNQQQPAHDRVRFVGLDSQHAGPPANRLLDATDTVAPSCPPDHRDTLAELATEGLVRGPDTPPEKRIERARDAVDSLREETTAADLSERNRWCLRTLEQSVELAEKQLKDETQGFSIARDRLMAENALAAIESFDEQGIAIWGHNAHIKRTPSTYDWGTSKPMGQVLAERCAHRYRPIGFDFGSGTYRAIDGRGDEYGDLGEWSLDPPKEGSVTALLDTVDLTPYYFDVSEATGDPHLGSWLSTKRARRWSGAVYYGDKKEHVSVDMLPEAFDGLIYIDESTPTTMLE